MTDAKARLLQMIADEPHMGGGGLLKAVTKAQKAAKAGQEVSKVMQPIVSAAEHEANLARLLAPSKTPMRLYHGTTATEGGKGTEAIRRLKPSKEGALGSGVYLTPSPAHASGYSGIPNDEALELMMGNPRSQDLGLKALNQRNSGNVLPAQQGGNMLPVYAQIKNPLILEGHPEPGRYRDPMVEALTKLGMDEDKATKMVERAYDQKGYIGKEVESRARAAGYDGIMQYRNGELSEVVSYNPNAIKSATGNQGTFDINDPDLSKATGGAVHMAGGGTHWSMGNPEQFVKNKSERIYPKHETMNRGVKEVKGVVDAFNQLVDQGVPIKDLVGGLVGAVPFVGPDLRKGMEGATVNLPAGFKKSATNPQVATGIEMAPAKVSDILGELKPSDFTGTKGMSNLLGDVGRGYAPNVLDVLDTLGMDITGFGGVGLGTAIKGGRKAAGALSNLAKSDTGYKLAQKALEYAPAAQPMNVVKDTGGNWRSGSVENALKPLKRGNYDIPQHIRDDLGIEDLPLQDVALNKWVDSNLTNYVKKQMATPGDPVRKLAEEGITHIPEGTRNPANMSAVRATREEAGFPEAMGKSNEAQLWEALADKPIGFGTAGEMMSVGKGEPWMQKVDPFTRVHAVAPVDSIGMAQDLGFDHIVDVLNEDIASGRIRPEQLNKISMEQAVRRTYEYDQEMAKKMRETQAKVTEGMPVHKEYPEGYKWIELSAGEKAKPKVVQLDDGSWTVEDITGHRMSGGFKSKQGAENALAQFSKSDKRYQEGIPETKAKALEQALKYEGDTMGHCVGGYCPDVIEGRSRIYSLRDAKGEPHVTVEVQPSKTLTPEKRAAQVESLMHRMRGEGMSEEEAMRQAEKLYPESETLSRIVQIKGKQNRAPKEDYLPFVQDFVKSGNWSDVGDIRNAGLRKTSDAFNENELKKIREAGIEVPAYASHEEIKSIGNQVWPGQYGDTNYAEGGEVKSFFEEKSAKQRLLDMIAEEPHMGIGVRPSRLQLQGEIANDTYGGIGGGGRATYIHPVGSDAAIRAYMEGGGYKPKDMDYKGQVNNMGISYEKEFKDGGEAHMARGGVLKAIETAQKTAKKAQMYSAVDKALEASKRGAGTGMEFANELAKTSGIKKAELVDRGIMVPSKNGPVLNPALTQLPKMSKQEFVSHLNEKYKPPGVRKITLGEQNLTHEAIDKKAMQMMADDVGDFVDRNGDITYEDAFNYSYDHDYDKYYERAKDELSEESGTKYSKYKMPGAENYRENLYQYEDPKGAAFTASHWDDPNILYHMRQTDRVTPTYTSEQIDAIGQRMADAMGTKVENLGSGAPEMMIRQGVISPLEAAQFAHAKGFRNMDIDMSPAQKRALHIEEIQSDWHQKGRDKGYGDQLKEGWSINEQEPGFFLLQQEGMGMPAAFGTKAEVMDKAKSYGAVVANVPDAPLKKNWHEHALKQALMDAAEGDYNQLLITPGAEQAKRFDLSQQIDTVEWNTDTGRLYVKEKETGDYRKIADNVTADNIADYVGKETANKLMEQPTSHSYKQLSGLDLQVGGEGMAGFYDKMVPSYLNDLGKKYGVRVGEHAIEGDVPYSKTTPTLADVQRLAQEMYGVSDIQAISALPLEQRNAINQAFADKVRAAHATKLHSFDITPEMREDILNNGLPMYQRGGEVHMGGGGVLKAIGKAQKAAKTTEKAAKVEHPLVFPRAAAKTIEDIRPIAQRMAEQMTGEFVKQNPKVTTNPAGKSRKQFERERSIPLETRNLVPERAAPDVNYEDYKGYALVGVPGDPTMGGVAKRGSLEQLTQPTVELTRVGDITPDYPVPLFGGPRYGDEDKFWASNLGAAVPIQKNASKLAEEYQSPVLAKYIKMGSGSENFALHNLDALLSIQRPEKLDKAKMAQLTEAIQAGSPKYGKFPGFTGFKDPADVLLQAQMDSNLRKHIAETLTKPTITDQLGLPNGLDVVAAITYPELRNLETGASGFSVGKMKPGATLQRGQSSHPTYDTDIPGSFIGRSKYPTPYEIAFPDTTAYARSKMTPGVQEFNMMKMLGPRERIDQQYIDEIKMYEQLMKQYTGKKKGGLAHTKKVKRHGNTVSN